jgi:hypothetical protein
VVEPVRKHRVAELRRGRLEVVRPDVGDGHPHARCDERLRHAEPDFAPASGDEGDLALDVPHVPTL